MVFFVFGHVARHAGSFLTRDLGIEPVPPAVKVWSLNPWTTAEVPVITHLGTSSQEAHSGLHLHGAHSMKGREIWGY